MRENTKLLPLREKFCDGQITCRLLRPLGKEETVIVAIPGGPGLSSRYLDPFMGKLSKVTGANVATMDLPNHGESKLSANGTLSYTQCLGFVRRAVEEIQAKSQSIAIFGQSFGARLAFDLLAELKETPSATLLTGFPYIFQVSSRLIERLNKLPLQSEEGPEAEKIHAENWKTILPVYAVKPLSSEAFNALATREEVPNGHGMLQGAPPIEEVAEKLKTPQSILIIQADEDPVVPDDNWNILKSLLPEANFVELEGVGHFPMAESPEAVLEAFYDFAKARIS